MDAERWQRVKAVFSEASGLEPQAQEQFLDSACTDDDALRREVRSLLAAHRAPRAILDRPATQYLPEGALDSVTTDRWIGKRMGAYELLAQIGRGGMGEVYRARRADQQYEKEVAIKLVRSGLDTHFVLARFRAERQILANLDHPGIARLIDGGVTDEGLPYLVMELVEGEPIDRYCEARNSSIRERLRLFREVCAAVSYAHQRLVVHRDLKPSNILVTADGSVRLLDFGIAKLLHASPSEPAPDATVTAISSLTPAFASPEQIMGVAVTTASDVYSLGVVLFHLLAGRGPYRTRVLSTADAIREVCETEPVRPSVAAQAMNAANEKPRPTPAGDVDDITLKALRKEPAKRYASVEQFSADIERFLTGEPVLAHGTHFSYRAGKFVKRNRVVIGAAALIACTLIGGIVTALHEARVAQEEQARAERNFARVRKLANSLMFELHDSIEVLPGSTAANRLLVNRALEYLGEISSENSKNQDLNVELAIAYRKVADIEGGYGSQNAGDFARALDSYRRSVALLEPIATSPNASVNVRLEFGTSLRQLAMAEMGQGKVDHAVALSRRAVDVATATQKSAPTNIRALRYLAAAQSDACVALDAIEDFKGMLAMCRASIATQSRVVAAMPGDRTAHRVLAVVDDRTSTMIDHAYARGRSADTPMEESIALHRKAVALDEALLASDADDERAKRDVVGDRANLGDALLLVARPQEALAEFTRAIALNDELSAQDASNIQTRINGAEVNRSIAEAYVGLGQAAAALTTAQAAFDALEKLTPEQRKAAAENTRAATLLTLGRAHSLAASAKHLPIASQVKEWTAAERAFEDSAGLFESLRSQGAFTNPGDPATASAGIAASKAALARLAAASR